MTHSTPILHQSNSLPQANWREPFLQRILIIAAVIGIFAVIPAVLGTDDKILQAIYVGVYITLVASILIRLPYPIKAGWFVALPLILGIASLSETGIRGDSLFFLLAFVTLSTLLIGPRSGIASVIITELTIIIMSYLILNDHYSLSDKFAFEGDLTDWISAGATQLLISLVIMTGLRMLHESFNQTQAQNETMVTSLRESQAELENRVSERTKELTRKTDQLSASAFVARQTAEIQELDKLLSNTVNLIARQFNLYHVGIYLINERGDYVILQAASSDGGKKLLERGHRLRVGMQGIIGFVADEKKSRVALDVNEDTIFQKNPELPDTRSELSLPLVVRNKVIGVLDLQSSNVQAFLYDDIEVFQTLADQIAVAIENTRLLSESQQIISQLEIASGFEVRQNWQTKSTSQKPAYHYSATGLRPATKSPVSNGKNVLEIPMVLRGQKIGRISLQRKDEFHGWTTQEEIVASEVATQTALALENIRLVEHTRQRAEREQAIAGIANRVRETLDLDMVLRTSAREIQSTLNLEEVEVRLMPQDKWDE
jgi:GAF domain-containing protein